MANKKSEILKKVHIMEKIRCKEIVDIIMAYMLKGARRKALITESSPLYKHLDLLLIKYLRLCKLK